MLIIFNRMSEKKSLIKKIEEERNSKVLIYITSDREPNQLHGQIAEPDQGVM